jgi:putative FmdB family regulatory protein
LPIFEYLCTACNRIYSFLSLAPTPAREPACPRCGATGLQRVPSAFAVQSTRKSAAVPSDTGSGDDDAGMGGLEAEAMRVMEGLDEKDAEDPRVMARVMRRLAEASGEPITPTMEEMLRRMEAGEDPETLEEELGDQLESEMDLGGEEGADAPVRDDGLYSF